MGETRRLILHIAISSDGFIATKDDGLEWLPAPSETEDYGMNAFMASVDCVIIGRKTWDVIRHFEDDPFSTFERHVLSFSTHDGVSHLSELKKKQGKDIWLLGGGILNGECLNAELIDEIILTKFPIELGAGIPVFGTLGVVMPPHWKKVSEKFFDNGVIQSSWVSRMDMN